MGFLHFILSLVIVAIPYTAGVIAMFYSSPWAHIAAFSCATVVMYMLSLWLVEGELDQ